ncbi:hypothetical protein BDV10DRAFT_50342 [Aspergillus recurvatus]
MQTTARRLGGTGICGIDKVCNFAIQRPIQQWLHHHGAMTNQTLVQSDGKRLETHRLPTRSIDEPGGAEGLRTQQPMEGRETPLLDQRSPLDHPFFVYALNSLLPSTWSRAIAITMGAHPVLYLAIRSIPP